MVVLMVRRYPCQRSLSMVMLMPLRVIPHRHYFDAFAMESSGETGSPVPAGNSDLCPEHRTWRYVDALALLHEVTHGAMRDLGRLATAKKRRLIYRLLISRLLTHDPSEPPA